MLVDVPGWRSSPNSSARARVSTVWIVTLAENFVKTFWLIISLVDYLAPALCVMPVSMYWLWSRLTTLHWSTKLVSKLRKQNYQVQAKTRPWQRRHPVTSVIAIFVQLAVEREAVAIRGAGNAQKVP